MVRALCESVALQDPETLYRESDPNFRRTLNQAIFEKLYIDEGAVSGAIMREPFGALKAVEMAYAADPNLGRRCRPTVDGPVSTTDLLVGALAGKGSSKTLVVEVTGRYSNRQIAQIAAELLDWALEAPG